MRAKGLAILGALHWAASASAQNTTIGHTVSNTILVFARDTASSYSATSGLSGYSIPFQLVIVPSTGIDLPVLNSTATQGNYGGIILLSEVSYDYSGNWASAITTDQFRQIYDYQSTFGVRMVRIDSYPGPDHGVTPAIPGAGCCGAGVEQFVSITNSTDFPTANIKEGATVSTQGIWHYPANIIDSNTTWQIATFSPSSDGTFVNSSAAAVVNQFGKRQQMVWFSSWATNWAMTSNYLQHAYIHWMTRGLTVGVRKIYLQTQIDDVHLATALYEPTDGLFRLRAADLAAHASWTTQLNARLPPGSSYFIELAHNGNGNIQAALKSDNSSSCSPKTAIIYTGDMASTDLEFKKPLGTGTDIWPTTPTTYRWSLTCSKQDPLLSWLISSSANLNAFAHVSHTFTHESLNNATYADTVREIQFNQAWLKSVGITSAFRFSPHGIIPPAITGLHNGDAIRAWMENGIRAVVGDNTRAVLMNKQNEFWPLTTTVANNGYDGLVIIPRWATNIYFNCDLAQCTTDEWIKTSAGSGPFTNLLKVAITTNTRHLLGLHHDPYMFHQANLRSIDVNATTIGDQTGQFSLLQSWVETVTQEITRLTNWPIISLKQDDIAADFETRMTRDQCNPNLQYRYSPDGQSILGVTVTANNNTCSVPIPVTLPGSARPTVSNVLKDQVGSEPLILWVPLAGSPVTLTLASPISVL